MKIDMNSGFRQIITILAAFLPAISVPAQDIPLLPSDPAVTKGVLPNGMAYYLVVNPDMKGTADFALVQKTGRLTASDSTGTSALSAADEAMTSLRRIKPSTPRDFLIRKGITPEKGGYFKLTDDATIYRFSDVRLGGGNVMDSTLLVIMDIADRANQTEDQFLKTWYAPSDQAVVIAGDIDVKDVTSKLSSMSYMIPAAKSSPRPKLSGSWSDEPVFRTSVHKNGNLSEVSVTWTSERAPQEYMNTIQPEIFEMNLNTLGTAMVNMMKRALKDGAVPVADVSFKNISGATNPYDDSFTVSIVLEDKNAGKALETIAGVAASIDAHGVDMSEFLAAESSYIQRLADTVNGQVKSNSGYVDRCVNAFLYNASLASEKERLAFHTSRALPDTMRQRLFTGIAKALLDGGRNLNVCSSVDTSRAKAVFDSAWTASAAAPAPAMRINRADTLNFPGTAEKVKIKSIKKEHVSGGSVWTFSNGFKVIYRKMASDRMYYNLALNGGYGSVNRFAAGEGAFLADYFMTCTINGLPAADFVDLLKTQGIVMNTTVNMSNMMISGSLPKNRMPLLLRSLLAISGGTAPERHSFNYYKECEYLKLEHGHGGPYSRMTAIDSIMCPNYKLSPYKQKGKITSNFISNAESFFDGQFRKMNDGVLVLVGNLDEEKLKKLLLSYVGGFVVSDDVMRRPVIRYQPVSGASAYRVEGDEDNVDVAMSARLPLTMENYIAANLAAMIIKDRVKTSLGDSGMHLNMSWNCRIYPDERLNLLMSVSGAAEGGFTLPDFNAIDITDDELKQYKSDMKCLMAVKVKDPAYWLNVIALRELDGKDLTTNYAAKIDAVAPAKIKYIFNILNAGCRVEYITRKK